MADNPFQEWVRRYEDDPSLFVREVFHTEPYPWQTEVLEQLADGRRRLSIASGHGVGKTALDAWAAIWFFLTRFKVKVIVTAPAKNTLEDGLMAEIKSWMKRLPADVLKLVEIKSDRVELLAAPEDAFISAKTSRAEKPDAFAGVHADNVLMIADEAAGVPDTIFEFGAGSMSGWGAITMLTGNPVRATGFFYESHTALREMWWTRTVSCIDTPGVSPEFIQEMELLYGPESNAYRIRVLGLFPKGDDDTIIPLEAVEAAVGRDVEVIPHAPIVWGLDVARLGANESALAKRKGNHVLEPVVTFHGKDLMQLCGTLVAEFQALPPALKPADICVDAIGMGAGVVDRLRELGLPVRGINVSEHQATNLAYGNLKAELWHGRMRAWFVARDCKIPKDGQLIKELTMIRTKHKSDGRLMVESKTELRNRGVSSPDRADALAMTFASTAISALRGSEQGAAWNQALHRDARGVV